MKVVFFILLVSAQIADAADDSTEKDLSRLQSMAESLEQRFEHSVVEILRVNRQPESTETDIERAVTGANAFFHSETGFVDGKSSGQVIQAWDGSVFTRIHSRESVEIKKGIEPPMPKRTPLGPILESLGFEGSLTDFLDEAYNTDRNRTTHEQAVAIQILPTEHDKTKVTVERTQQLATEKARVKIRLAIDLNGGFRIVEGRSENHSAGAIVVTHAKKIDYFETRKSNLCYCIRGVDEAANTKITRFIRVLVEPAESIDDGLYQPTAFSGNPNVELYANHRIQDEYKYRDRRRLIDRPGGSPFDRWMLMNVVFLAIYLVWTTAHRAKSKVRGAESCE